MRVLPRLGLPRRAPVLLLRVALVVLSLGLTAQRAAGQQTGTIRGVVVDTEGGTPIEQVSVRLQDTGQVVSTAADGRFEFTTVPAGEHELYVSVVNFLLVRRQVDVSPGATTELTIALTQGTGTYTESVSVVGAVDQRATAPPAEARVHGIELQQLSGLLANDPLRAVQAMPGVTTGDDFRSEFAVRGAGPLQTGFVFDGISTRFMLHTVERVNDAGSIAMINGEVLDAVTLRSGSYPGKYGNRVGAEVEFQMREGSRERPRTHISVSAIDASAVSEGPLGADSRGSWLVAARKSYLDLVLKRVYQDQRVNFGFADVQSKLACDLSAQHRLELSVTGGRSHLDLVPDEVTNPNDLREATSDSGIGVLAWRYTPSTRLAIVQRFAGIGNTFRNVSRDSLSLDDGGTTEAVYRADLTSPVKPWLTVDGGVERRWTVSSGSEVRTSSGRLVTRERFDEASTRVGGYLSARLKVGAAVITPGARVDRWSIVERSAASPWMTASVPLGRGLTLRAGSGVYHQAPEPDQVYGLRGNRALGPSRAWQADVGVEGRVAQQFRWQVSAYNREDRGWLRLPFDEVQRAGNVVIGPSLVTTWQNSLDGHARGVEWLFERRAERGVTGWVSYSLGFNRYSDRLTGEQFWGDYDQRHTFNAFGTWRASDRTSLSARFRMGSNTPAPGYWTEQAGRYFVTTDRNGLRIPAYSRLDFRANRTFTPRRSRLTLFVEVLNVLARPNERFLEHSVNRRTFETTRPFESMLPLVPSAGLLIEF
ncbi:MAG: TonB-dependent receptor [Acidobacteria bacterium]|nr:TonB-dependent receptor [Acidobacteriota bacterium]